MKKVLLKKDIVVLPTYGLTRRLLTRVLLILVLGVMVLGCNHNKKFDKELWINDVKGFYPERRKMVEDLIESKILENKDTSDIIKILGNPDCIDTTKTGKLSEMHYLVQISCGFDIDPLFAKRLILKIDTNNNKLLNLRIYKDKDDRTFIEKIITE